MLKITILSFILFSSLAQAQFLDVALPKIGCPAIIMTLKEAKHAGFMADYVIERGLFDGPDPNTKFFLYKKK